MTGSTFSVVFGSDILAVKNIVDEALNYLRASFPRISSEEFFDFKLLMSELLLNAVTHGNNSDARKKVSFSMKISTGSSVLIEVIDEGSGFDITPLLDKEIFSHELMQESGRGLKLINSLADEVICGKFGNQIKIYKKVVSNG